MDNSLTISSRNNVGWLRDDKVVAKLEKRVKLVYPRDAPGITVTTEKGSEVDEKQ